MSKTSHEPRIEIQFHPADTRRGVRRLQLGDTQVAVLRVLLLAYAVFLAVAAALTPAVMRNLLSASDYSAQVAQRAAEGLRLKAAVERLTALDGQADQLHARMAKVYLAYGLSGDTGVAGQGGYPAAEGSVPPSIYDSVIRYGRQVEARLGSEIGVLESFLSEVRAFESAHRDLTRTTPSLCPLHDQEFVLISGFGSRRNPFTKAMDRHSGVDLAAPIGSPVYAPADGVVTFAGRYPLSQNVVWWRYGNLVAIRHGDQFVTLFGHLDAITVKAGQRLRQGDELGLVGNTGWSTSPHLHYEVRRLLGGSFQAVDPRIYVLDHDWRDDERPLGSRPSAAPDFEPLPAAIGGLVRPG
jgi:murein DD-endopeptidase MepM/ murein hydrolase activator NlpD